MKIENQKNHLPVYPKLPQRGEGAPLEKDAHKIHNFASAAFRQPLPSAPPKETAAPCAPPLEALEEEGVQKEGYEPHYEYHRESDDQPGQYVPGQRQFYKEAPGAYNFNHIDFQNPLKKIAEEPLFPIADQAKEFADEVREAADDAANALKEAANIAAPVVMNAAANVKNVAAPVAGFALNTAWNALKGVGNLAWNAFAPNEPVVNPETVRQKRQAEARYNMLKQQYNKLEEEELLLKMRDWAILTLPAVNGYIFGNLPGLFVGITMGMAVERICRVQSQSFESYKQKAATALQIKNEIHRLTNFLGLDEPALRPIFY